MQTVRDTRKVTIEHL